MIVVRAKSNDGWSAEQAECDRSIWLIEVHLCLMHAEGLEVSVC